MKRYLHNASIKSVKCDDKNVNRFFYIEAIVSLKMPLK